MIAETTNQRHLGRRAKKTRGRRSGRRTLEAIVLIGGRRSQSRNKDMSWQRTSRSRATIETKSSAWVGEQDPGWNERHWEEVSFRKDGQQNDRRGASSMSVLTGETKTKGIELNRSLGSSVSTSAVVANGWMGFEGEMDSRWELRRG